MSQQATSFASLGLAPWLLSACSSLSLSRPTPIQSLAIPHLLAGRNAVLHARTGSGKTLAFALPLLHALSKDAYGVFALLLAPTRELASQLADALHALGTDGMPSLQVALICGGGDQQQQALALAARPHLVIATPGRLAQLLRSDAQLLHAQHLAVLVCDEADRLLDDSLSVKDGGFAADLHTILAALPPADQRQTVLASATLGGQGGRQQAQQRMARLAKEKMGVEDPVFCSTVDEAPSTSASSIAAEGTLVPAAAPLLTPHSLAQHYLLTPAHLRDVYLHYLLTAVHPYSDGVSDAAARARAQVIVFAGSCAECARLQLVLSALFEQVAQAKSKQADSGKRGARSHNSKHKPEDAVVTTGKPGSRVVALHSRLSQGRRLAALAAFKNHTAQILVCTDLAARGLDCEAVSCVVNYETPRDADDYVHRVGRAARMGRQGQAITFVTPTDISALQRIERHCSQGKRMDSFEHLLPERKVCEPQHLKLVLDAVALTSIRQQQYELSERRKKQGTKRSYELTRQELKEQNQQRQGNTVKQHKVQQDE